MSPVATVGGSIEEIGQRILEHYPVSTPAPRRIGREIELPLVDREGWAGEVGALWPEMLELPGSTPHYDNEGELLTGVERPYGLVAVEFGRGVVEIALDPADGLQELQTQADLALAELKESAGRAGLFPLGVGMQPRSAGTMRQLTPKRRYVQFVESVGPRLLRCTGSAADQVHVDVGREELLAALNVINGLAGAVVAIAANSPLYAGRPGRARACREAYIGAVFDEPHRWGSTPRRFESIEDYVGFVTSFKPLWPPDESVSAWEQFVELDHYVMPSGRAVFRFGTVEVRPACQQPFDSFWAPAAMGLGLVANVRAADEWLIDSGVSWAELLGYRARAVTHGIRAKEPFDGFLAQVLSLAQEGLVARGLGEETYLEDAWSRLERRQSPADEVMDLLSKEGIDGIIRARCL